MFFEKPYNVILHFIYIKKAPYGAVWFTLYHPHALSSANRWRYNTTRMGNEGQEKTKDTYSDPKIVAGYLETHGRSPKLAEQVEAFAATLPGKKVIDVGCGPGHDSYHFAKLGYAVTGVDYSSEMIRTAESFEESDNPPNFEVLDMRDIGKRFDEDSFDGAWVSASLLHIPEEDVPVVLRGLKKIVVNGGKVYIGLKAGEQGAQVVTEDKYGQQMEREFIFWEEDNFKKVAEENGLKVESADGGKGGKTGEKEKSWLNFHLKVVK
jgi:SAM-dependent methyltransferase